VYYQDDKINVKQTGFNSSTERDAQGARGTPAGQRHSAHRNGMDAKVMFTLSPNTLLQITLLKLLNIIFVHNC
jgi:hypothetical protein